MEENPTEALAQDLEQWIWSLPATKLLEREADLLARARSAEVEVAAVLAELADETLALAFQKGLLRRLVFQEWLVQRYERDLTRWFWEWTGDRELARDLTQEIYLKLLGPRAVWTYNPERLFLPWLRAVARNLLMEHFRRDRPVGALPAEGLLSRAPGPLEQAAARECEQRFDAELNRLPAEQARVLRLAVCGATANELAAALGVPKPRVYQLLFKARRAVETAFHQKPPPPLSPGSPTLQHSSPAKRWPLP